MFEMNEYEKDEKVITPITIYSFYNEEKDQYTCPWLLLILFCLTCETYGVQESSPPSLCSDWVQRSADWRSPEAEAGRVHNPRILPVNQKDTAT